MAGFERNEDTLYSVPLRFAEVKLKKCPLCGEEKPRWLVKEEWKLLGKLYHFMCPQCGSILRISQDDVTGFSFTTATLSGKRKKHKGKDSRKIYVTVEKIGLQARTAENIRLEGAEASLEELFGVLTAGSKSEGEE